MSSAIGWTRVVVALSAALVVAPSALGGPDWVEVGDAGSDYQTGQAPRPLASGVLSTIAGSLGGRGVDLVDAYIIGVADPVAFSFEIETAGFDAQLFIFHITLAGGAYGLLANDDRALDDMRPRVLPVATDGTSVVLDLPGDYLIAISGRGYNPISATGLIFDLMNPTEISGADGPGSLNRHIGWSGEGGGGDYQIELTGAEFPTVPTPAGGAVALGGLVLALRRRRPVGNSQG
ncbi:MAG: hypothetical protein H7Y88_00470 [Phycisphaerales bacterium]|nr:hypothetical protein [Phycisphaerales bacterium]